MKTLLLLALAGTLSAHAQSQSLEERMQQADQQIQAELDKTYKSKDGIEIRNVKKSLIDQTIQRLDGNVTIEFGKDKRIPIPRSGSVVVGSGADGTIATSDTDSSASVVLKIPLKPKMSLTLVGGDGFFCMARIKKNPDGTIKRKGSYLQTGMEDGSCNSIGKAIRPMQPGTYLVTVNYLSEMFVEINQDENKVIPLREIVIPFVDPSQQSVLFKIYRDFETSDIEREKMIQKAFALYEGFKTCSLHNSNVCDPLAAANTLEAFRPFFAVVAKEETANFGVMSLDKSYIIHSLADIKFRGELSLRGGQYDENKAQSYAGVSHNNIGRPVLRKEAFKYHVLPGVYGMRWLIDGQFEVTKGIYVQ